MFYSKDPRYPTHENCHNFINGVCTLNGAPVDPDGPACPRFAPKITNNTIGSKAGNHGAKRPYQIHPWLGARQRLDRRGGRGFDAGDGVSRMKGYAAYPYPPMRPRITSTTVKTQEREMLEQRLEELEKRLKEVRDELERLA